MLKPSTSETTGCKKKLYLDRGEAERKVSKFEKPEARGRFEITS